MKLPKLPNDQKLCVSKTFEDLTFFSTSAICKNKCYPSDEACIFPESSAKVKFQQILDLRIKILYFIQKQVLNNIIKEKWVAVKNLISVYKCGVYRSCEQSLYNQKSIEKILKIQKFQEHVWFLYNYIILKYKIKNTLLQHNYTSHLFCIVDPYNLILQRN